MKTFSEYNKTIRESVPQYTLFPKSKEELEAMIDSEIASQGYSADLNHIDVSGIEDFSSLFFRRYKFDGDVSRWDVSNAKDMHEMFMYAESFT